MKAILTFVCVLPIALGWVTTTHRPASLRRPTSELQEGSVPEPPSKQRVTIVGAGWGGLSAAYHLSKHSDYQVTLIESAPRVGGLVRDGYTTINNTRPAEAGQHGFWDNYLNIYRLFDELPSLNRSDILTDFMEQGQYSPRGLEAVWPVYRESPKLPTGLAQAAYTTFLSLPLQDRLSAFPLVLAFSEFDDSPEAWRRYDEVSFRDLCMRLGVSRRCYEEAFEPMILTGLFAPGAECSAAAALGMAYFFVLQNQLAFDVQWCRGNIGETIFQPWVAHLKEQGVNVQCSTRVTGFDMDNTAIRAVKCSQADGSSVTLDTDHVILAVSATALKRFVQASPELAAHEEFRRFANLRGTSVLATRIFLDRNITMHYPANACWGFDMGVGMTMFDIRALHGNQAASVKQSPGSVIEVDYYHAANLLAMSDKDIVVKVKRDLDILLGIKCEQSQVADAAVVRLPEGVNWYFPGSYKSMPDLKSSSLMNLYFAGDIVRTRHGSWSQEKAFVTGMEAANLLLRRPVDENVLAMRSDEAHVKLGRNIVTSARTLLGLGDPAQAPSLVDFLRR